MKIIGLTGGIGTGKSTVSSILHNLGAKIIDADIISRQVTGKGSPVLKSIAEAFGNDIIDENGEMRRSILASRVFSNKEALEKLNSITHPAIGDRICEIVNNEKNLNENDTIVVDVAIPFVHGFRDIAEEIWVVTAEKEKRIERIMKRNNYSREEALGRINSQMTEQEYLSIADVIIENNGDITELEQRVVKQFYFKPEGAV